MGVIETRTYAITGVARLHWAAMQLETSRADPAAPLPEGLVPP